MAFEIDQNFVPLLLFGRVLRPYRIQQRLPLQCLHKHGKGHLLRAELAIAQILKKPTDLPGLRVVAIALDDLQKFGELNLTRSVIVYFLNHIHDLVNVLCEPKADQRVLKLLDADRTRPVLIQCHEHVLELTKFTKQRITSTK